eukprot:7792345-Karenia_brevis.AAC.1
MAVPSESMVAVAAVQVEQPAVVAALAPVTHCVVDDVVSVSSGVAAQVVVCFHPMAAHRR